MFGFRVRGQSSCSPHLYFFSTTFFEFNSRFGPSINPGHLDPSFSLRSHGASSSSKEVLLLSAVEKELQHDWKMYNILVLFVNHCS